MPVQDFQHPRFELIGSGRCGGFGGRDGTEIGPAEELKPLQAERVGDLEEVAHGHGDLAAEDLLVDGVAHPHLLLQRPDGDALTPDLVPKDGGQALSFLLIAVSIHGS
ncbi:MAG TPA: hypothetical protein VFR03_00450 [Thermoanaerobaculia bacterium]|nr:hypothetical protein [Thermoanaerobaculia bacterium]